MQYQASLEEQVIYQQMRQEELEQELEDRRIEFEEKLNDIESDLDEMWGGNHNINSARSKVLADFDQSNDFRDVLISGDPNNTTGIPITDWDRAQLIEQLGILKPEDDAFLLEAATFGRNDFSPEFASHRRLWVCRVAECVNISIPDGARIQVWWTEMGEMVVSYC
jgi:hypothetical protein